MGSFRGGREDDGRSSLAVIGSWAFRRRDPGWRAPSQEWRGAREEQTAGQCGPVERVKWKWEPELKRRAKSRHVVLFSM